MHWSLICMFVGTIWYMCGAKSQFEIYKYFAIIAFMGISTLGTCAIINYLELDYNSFFSTIIAAILTGLIMWIIEFLPKIKCDCMWKGDCQFCNN